MTYFLPLLLIVSAGPIAADADNDDNSAVAPEKVALDFVTAAFFERDVDKAIKFVKMEAERKSYGKGSVIRDLREEIPNFPPVSKLALREIYFSMHHDLGQIVQRIKTFISERDGTKHSDPSVDINLLKKELRVTDASFVTLLIWKNARVDGKAEFSHMLFVFDSINGKWKITYMTGD